MALLIAIDSTDVSGQCWVCLFSLLFSDGFSLFNKDGLLHPSFNPSVLSVQTQNFLVYEGVSFVLEVQLNLSHTSLFSCCGFSTTGGCTVLTAGDCMHSAAQLRFGYSVCRMNKFLWCWFWNSLRCCGFSNSWHIWVKHVFCISLFSPLCFIQCFSLC